MGGRAGKKAAHRKKTHREAPRRQRTWHIWESAISVGRQCRRRKGRGGMARPQAGTDLSEPVFDLKSIYFVTKAKGSQRKILGRGLR